MAAALGNERSGQKQGGRGMTAAGNGAIRSEVLLPKGFWVKGVNTTQSISFIGTDLLCLHTVVELKR